MKIEAGKYYWTRGGYKVGPMYNDSTGIYPWQSSPDLFSGWTDDGVYYVGLTDENDLVAEWQDEPAETLREYRDDEVLARFEPAPPDDNPKTAAGLQKPPLHAIPPSALLQLGAAMADGERKYGLFNWREHNVSSTVYYDAALRHLLAWWDGEDTASDSGVDHLGHVMACCAILIDAKAGRTLNDNRGPAGSFSAVVELMRQERQGKA